MPRPKLYDFLKARDISKYLKENHVQLLFNYSYTRKMFIYNKFSGVRVIIPIVINETFLSVEKIANKLNLTDQQIAVEKDLNKIILEDINKKIISKINMCDYEAAELDIITAKTIPKLS